MDTNPQRPQGGEALEENTMSHIQLRTIKLNNCNSAFLSEILANLSPESDSEG
jgi:hypothetical protein